MPNNYKYGYDAEGKHKLQHRIVLEKHLGRKLITSEVIHHINGDKTDNRIENLEITTLSEHSKLHHRQGDIGRKKFMIRKNFYIENEQLEFLESFSDGGISISEHIRRAISDYINILRGQNATESLSKKGGENGR